MRSLARSALVASAAIAIGMLGASAFNPDNGSVAHVEMLWRIFGIGVYLGVLALWVLTLTAIVLVLTRTVGACRRRHDGVSG
jgi:hypothetical protein